MDRIPLRDSIFSRIIALFVLSLLPVYILVLFFFEQGRSILTKEITSSMRAEVTRYLGQFDAELSRIRALGLDLVNDGDLNYLVGTHAIMSVYEKTVLLNRLQRRLMIIRGSSPYIETISVHIFPLDRSLNASSLAIGSISEIDPAQRDSLMHSPAFSDSLLKYEGDRISLRLGGSADSSLNNSPLYTIDVHLSNVAIRSDLARFGSSEWSSIVLFDRNLQFVLSSAEDPRIGVSVAQAAELAEATTSFIEIGGSRLLFVRANSEMLRMSLVKYISEDLAFQTLGIYKVWLLLFTSAVILLVFPFAAYSYAKVRKPLKTIVSFFSRIEAGDFDVRIRHHKKDEFGYLFGGFNSMARSLKLMLDQVAEQRSLAHRAELRQLQSQINPHFLYNSYFLLHRLIKVHDTVRATAFSKMMGKYFEYITRNDPNEASLEAETDHARNYVDIQALRFEGRFTAEFGKLPDGMTAIAIPPLILQPLIENAFKHAIEKRKDGGVLKVNFSTVQLDGQPFLHIVVEDNGETLDEAGLLRLKSTLANSNRSGDFTSLYNIHRRLTLRFGPDSGLRAERSSAGGLSITIAIPLAAA